MDWKQLDEQATIRVLNRDVSSFEDFERVRFSVWSSMFEEYAIPEPDADSPNEILGYGLVEASPVSVVHTAGDQRNRVPFRHAIMTFSLIVSKPQQSFVRYVFRSITNYLYDASVVGEIPYQVIVANFTGPSPGERSPEGWHAFSASLLYMAGTRSDCLITDGIGSPIVDGLQDPLTDGST